MTSEAQAIAESRASLSAPPKPTPLSVVVVNWNTKDLLLQLLEDLLPWTESRELEIVIVDNASQDGSVDAARLVYPDAEFPCIRWLPQDTNHGFAGGVNRGFAAAQHAWILLLNTDVRCKPADLEALCAYGDRAEDVAILGPDIRNEDGSPQESCWRFPTLWQLFCSTTWLYKVFPRSDFFNGERYAGRRFQEPTDVDAVSGCVFLLRREVFDRIGGLDEGFFMYFEETDLCRRARDAGWRVRYAPVAEFVHYLGGSSRLARKRNFLEFRRSLVRYHRKHGGRARGLLARVLVTGSLLLRLPIWGIRSLASGNPGREGRAMLRLHAAAIIDPCVRWSSRLRAPSDPGVRE